MWSSYFIFTQQSIFWIWKYVSYLTVKFEKNIKDVNFTYLKLWIAQAKHSFKRVKIRIKN